MFRLNDGFGIFVLWVDFESLLLCLKEDVDLYAHLFDFYISLHLEQFDVHDSFGNVYRDLNCEVSIFWFNIVEDIFYEYGVHELCANSTFEPCSNYANESCINPKVMSLKGSLIVDLQVKNHVQNLNFLI